MSEHQGPNPSLIIQSLQRQLSNAHYQIAEQEAVTLEIIDQKKDLEKELESYREKEIAEMDDSLEEPTE